MPSHSTTPAPYHPITTQCPEVYCPIVDCPEPDCPEPHCPEPYCPPMCDLAGWPECQCLSNLQDMFTSDGRGNCNAGASRPDLQVGGVIWK